MAVPEDDAQVKFQEPMLLGFFMMQQEYVPNGCYSRFRWHPKSRVTEDLPASEIQRKEKEYFTHSRPGAEDLARKLSDKAGKEAGFVADRSIWSSV